MTTTIQTIRRDQSTVRRHTSTKRTLSGRKKTTNRDRSCVTNGKAKTNPRTTPNPKEATLIRNRGIYNSIIGMTTVTDITILMTPVEEKVGRRIGKRTKVGRKTVGNSSQEPR